ncbi:hypothetical protein L1987_78556 [Smallanthus sonchifolius]|uniref:Uncharacterized protein n=1 Tax=Smallanthus sonchifolius TaxID=185202 RepID=A0ACB8ZE13_9ASTR|nr:hypothetical protein L1987_78556 [Smallanthus sonchifolius]
MRWSLVVLCMMMSWEMRCKRRNRRIRSGPYPLRGSVLSHPQFQLTEFYHLGSDEPGSQTLVTLNDSTWDSNENIIISRVQMRKRKEKKMRKTHAPKPKRPEKTCKKICQHEVGEFTGVAPSAMILDELMLATGSNRCDKGVVRRDILLETARAILSVTSVGGFGYLAKECKAGQSAGPSREAVPVKKDDEKSKAKARAFTMTAAEAKTDPNVVSDTFLINNVPASVLFDSGASNSFVASSFC